MTPTLFALFDVLRAVSLAPPYLCAVCSVCSVRSSSWKGLGVPLGLPRVATCARDITQEPALRTECYRKYTPQPTGATETGDFALLAPDSAEARNQHEPGPVLGLPRRSRP